MIKMKRNLGMSLCLQNSYILVLVLAVIIRDGTMDFIFAGVLPGNKDKE
jgi:hypothetical protein